MARLTRVASRLSAPPARLARQTDTEGHSATTEPWRAWYHLARWKHPTKGVRIRVLTRDRFTCQWPGCGHVERDLSQLVADHREPHRGDPVLFWDDQNVWTLCRPHHDSAKQAQERRARGA